MTTMLRPRRFSRHSIASRAVCIWTALGLLAACGRGSANDARTAGRDESAMGTVPPSTSNAGQLGCGASTSDSDPIPYSAVALGPGVHDGVGYVPGPALRAMVRSQDEWTRAWRAVADTVTAPKVNLRDSVLILVASQEYTSGPFRLEIEGVRKCRRGGDLVTLLRLHSAEAMQDYGDRSIRAVLIPRSAAVERTIHFVDLPPVIHR